MPSVVQAPFKVAVVGPPDVEFEDGVDTDGTGKMARDGAAAVEVAKVVAIVPFPPAIATEEEMEGATAATVVFAAPTPVYWPLLAEDAVVGAAVTTGAGAELAAPAAAVALDEEEPLPPIGKQLVPAGVA